MQFSHGKGFKVNELEWMKCFSKKLREMLEYTNMTQTDLAIESGVSTANISRYINCITMPRASALVNLAYAFNCSVDELVDFGSKIT